MKLSEAIREGAKIRPQAFGKFFAEGEEQATSCALGAAMEGAGLVPMPLNFGNAGYDTLRQEWPEIEAQEITCPAGCKNDWRCEAGGSIEDIIQHLNDTCRWTREQIADWLQERGY